MVQKDKSVELKNKLMIVYSALLYREKLEHKIENIMNSISPFEHERNTSNYDLQVLKGVFEYSDLGLFSAPEIKKTITPEGLEDYLATKTLESKTKPPEKSFEEKIDETNIKIENLATKIENFKNVSAKKIENIGNANTTKEDNAVRLSTFMTKFYLALAIISPILSLIMIGLSILGNQTIPVYIAIINSIGWIFVSFKLIDKYDNDFIIGVVVMGWLMALGNFIVKFQISQESHFVIDAIISLGLPIYFLSKRNEWFAELYDDSENLEEVIFKHDKTKNIIISQNQSKLYAYKKELKTLYEEKDRLIEGSKNRDKQKKENEIKARQLEKNLVSLNKKVNKFNLQQQNDLDIANKALEEYVSSPSYEEALSLIPATDTHDIESISLLYWLVNTRGINTYSELMEKFDTVQFRENMLEQMRATNAGIKSVVDSIDKGMKQIGMKLDHNAGIIEQAITENSKEIKEELNSTKKEIKNVGSSVRNIKNSSDIFNNQLLNNIQNLSAIQKTTNEQIDKINSKIYNPHTGTYQ